MDGLYIFCRDISIWCNGVYEKGTLVTDAGNIAYENHDTQGYLYWSTNRWICDDNLEEGVGTGYLEQLEPLGVPTTDGGFYYYANDWNFHSESQIVEIDCPSNLFFCCFFESA